MKTLFQIGKGAVRLLFGCIGLVVSLWMNVLTVPLFLICLLVCALAGARKPAFGRLGLMLYPSWKDRGASAKLQTINFLKTAAIALVGLTALALLLCGQWLWGAAALLATVFVAGLLNPQYRSGQPSSDAPQGAMTGRGFEHHCAELLKKKGFRKVTVTPASGDYGADLVAYDCAGSKWVFQCKYYSGKVDNTAVQEVTAAKAHYQAQKAAVMTNSRLTDQARQLAQENGIVLYEQLPV